MVSYHDKFRQLLQSAVGDVAVYYESFSEKVAVPCVSYLEASNTQTAKGDTLNYSSLSFQVKIWAETIGELIELADSIDSILKDNGFTRSLSIEQKEEKLLVKILRYNAIGYEKI